MVQNDCGACSGLGVNPEPGLACANSVSSTVYPGCAVSDPRTTAAWRGYSTESKRVKVGRE